jgi:hypothetical protein
MAHNKNRHNSTKNKLVSSKIEIKQAMPGKEFFLADGKILKDIYELSKAFEDMHDNTFNHHVNSHSSKNDFAFWIMDTLEDIELAQRLDEVKDKTQYLDVINDRLKELNLK